MSADPAVTTWQQTIGGGDHTQRLFHIPTDEVQEQRMDAGLSWRTLCGENRPPAREIREFLDAPDECLVCIELEADEIA